MSVSDIKANQRRLRILQLLEADPDYTIDSELLAQLLSEIGFSVSHATLLADLAVLTELGLVHNKDISGVKMAVLRTRGVEAAKGLISVPMVARPGPH